METAQNVAVAFGSWQPRLARFLRLETSHISGRAYTLSGAADQLVVVEQENDLAAVQTEHSPWRIHSGYRHASC